MCSPCYIYTLKPTAIDAILQLEFVPLSLYPKPRAVGGFLQIQRSTSFSLAASIDITAGWALVGWFWWAGSGG